MRIYVGSFILGAIVGLAAAKVLEGKLPEIKIAAGGCCEDEEEPEAAAETEAAEPVTESEAQPA